MFIDISKSFFFLQHIFYTFHVPKEEKSMSLTEPTQVYLIKKSVIVHAGAHSGLGRSWQNQEFQILFKNNFQNFSFEYWNFAETK